MTVDITHTFGFALKHFLWRDILSHTKLPERILSYRQDRQLRYVTLLLLRRYSAAFSSACPPISPINTIPATYGQSNVQTVLQYVHVHVLIFLRGLGLVSVVVKHWATYPGIACSIPHSPNLNYVNVKVDMYGYYPGKWSQVLYTWHFINLVCHVGGRFSLLQYGSQTQKN